MNNTKRFFTQLWYTDIYINCTLREFITIFIGKVLADFKVVYDSIESKIQTVLEPEDEKDMMFKQNRFPTFASILEVLGTRQKNKFYPANPSLWVVFVSCFMGILIIVFVSILHSQDFIAVASKQFGVAIVGSVLCLTFWISLFYKEKVYGYHTDIIRKNISLSFWVFLFTEGLCFMSLFWTFFHSFLAASTHIGQFAPGEGVVNYYINEDLLMHPKWDVFIYADMSDTKIHNFSSKPVDRYTYDHTLTSRFHFNLFDCGQLIDPYGYPGLNTALLLISATILTSCHGKIKKGKYLKSFIFLALTLLFGAVFMCVQFLEIKGSTLQYNDGIYACSFYSLTGLHGIHVILGVCALFLCFVNFAKGNYTRKRHDTFWYAVAYWHFVDVVWVLVYIFIYLWPSCLYFSDYVRYSYLGYKDYCFNINTKVFEKKLFEKIVMDSNGLVFEIIDFYKSVHFNKKTNDCKHLLKTLYSCEENAQEWLNLFFSKVAAFTSNDAIIVPYLSRAQSEENEYSGYGENKQKMFLSEDLRNSVYYKKYYSKLLFLYFIGQYEYPEIYISESLKQYVSYSRTLDDSIFYSHRDLLNQSILKSYSPVLTAVLGTPDENIPLPKVLRKWKESEKTEYKKQLAAELAGIWEMYKAYIDFIAPSAAFISGLDSDLYSFKHYFKRLRHTKSIVHFDSLYTSDYPVLKRFLIDRKYFAIVDKNTTEPTALALVALGFAKIGKPYDKVFNGLNYAQENPDTSVQSFLNKAIRKNRASKFVNFENMPFVKQYLAEYNKRMDRLDLVIKPISHRGYYPENYDPVIDKETVCVIVKRSEGDEKLGEYKINNFIKRNYTNNISYTDSYTDSETVESKEPKKDVSPIYSFYEDVYRRIIKNKNLNLEKIEFSAIFHNFLENDEEFKKKILSIYNKKSETEKNFENLNSDVCVSADFSDKFKKSMEIFWEKLNKGEFNLADGFPLYGISDEPKNEKTDREILIENLNKLCQKGGFLHAFGLTFDDLKNDYKTIDERRKINLASVAIDPAPTTLAEGIEREIKKKKDAIRLAKADAKYALIAVLNEYDRDMPDERILLDMPVYFPRKELLGEHLYFEIRMKELNLHTVAKHHYVPFIIELDKNISLKEEALKRLKKASNIDQAYIISGLVPTQEESIAFKQSFHTVYGNLFKEIIDQNNEHINKVKNIKINKIDTVLHYFELYKSKKYMNYSELKDDKHLYAVFLNVFHHIAFDYMEDWRVTDLTTWRSKVKFPILFVLYCININWAFTFAARFMPYLLTSDFEVIWGDLLYTRKPKWAIKKD